MLERNFLGKKKGTLIQWLVGVQINTAIMEISLEIAQKLKIELPYGLAVSPLHTHPVCCTPCGRDACVSQLIAALLAAAGKSWSQTPCPSADERITKTWHV